MIPVFPYPTVFGDIDLEVVSVSIDGSSLPYARISKTERTVALHQAGRERWDIATIRVRATLPADEISTGPWTEVRCLAVLTEKATNSRVTAQLTTTSRGAYEGYVDLARLGFLTRATLTVAFVGTVEDVAGRLIGSTPRAWYIDLRTTTPARQREIDIVEIDFRDGPEAWLRPFKDAPWIVDTSGDIPTVYLNTTAVEGFVEVLHGTGGTGAERGLRETISSQIAQETWTAMFQSAISDLELDEDGTPQMPGGWRGSVLTSMLPDVFPNLTATDALYEINQRRTKGFSWSELQTLLQYAAGRRSQISRRLTTAVRSVLRSEEGGNR